MKSKWKPPIPLSFTKLKLFKFDPKEGYAFRSQASKIESKCRFD